MDPTLIDPPSDSSAPEFVTLDQAGAESTAISVLDLLNSYAHIFVAAFVVTLLATPIVRRIAFTAGVVDHPDGSRKVHQLPTPYLGGVAVFLGLIVAVFLSYFAGDEVTAEYPAVPIAVVIGMVAITFAGLADDLWGWDPRLKIAGQLVAAAALAINDVGVHVAEGLFRPFIGGPDQVLIDLFGFAIFNSSLFYWTGTALIALFVLGGCNSANLVDGLDGLLTGIVAIVAVGLLAICLLMAPEIAPGSLNEEAGSMAGARIVLCVALLGTALGFLPHNFNPATIFLGDCGSLLLGYMCAVIILMLGDRGQTHLVFAGLIVFSLPIMDTVLAMIRRRLAGVPLSAPDSQHIHHQLTRSLGSVRRAVFTLYGISLLFAGVGVTLAALVMRTGLRVRIVYAFAIVLFGFIGVMVVKAARRQQHLAAVARLRRQAADGQAASSPRVDGTAGSASMPAAKSPVSPEGTPVTGAPPGPRASSA